jgi:hypothetical protein
MLIDTAKQFIVSTSVIFFGFFFLVTIAMGGPQFWVNCFREIGTAQGFTLGCKEGGRFSYKYTVQEHSYEGHESICKAAIPSDKPIIIYYVATDPSISWGYSPREFALEFCIGVSILSVVGAALSWNKFWGRQ